MSYRARHCEQSPLGVGKSSTLQLSTPVPECLFPMGFLVLNKLGTRVSPAILASRLRCDGLEAADGRVDAAIEWRFSIGFHSGELLGRFKCRGTINKETIDLGVISDREVWIVIRYLDPELDRRGCDTAAAIACLAVVCIVCIVWVLLHVRGL